MAASALPVDPPPFGLIEGVHMEGHMEGYMEGEVLFGLYKVHIGIIAAATERCDTASAQCKDLFEAHRVNGRTTPMRLWRSV